MKKIEEAATEYRNIRVKATLDFGEVDLSASIPCVEYESEKGFISGVEFSQRWISVEEKPDDLKIDEEGIFYSDYILLKVVGYAHPFIGYYVKANDDEFFDFYPEVLEIINQHEITHWRPIELK